MPQLPKLSEIYENRGKILSFAVVGLLALCVRLQERVAARDAVIAARPAVDAKTESRQEKREQKGPRTIKRTFAPPPPTASCPAPQPVLLDETITEGPSDTYESLEKASERQEAPPALPAPRPKSRYLLLTLDPGRSFMPRRIQGGMSFMDKARVSPMLGASYDWRHAAAGFEVGARF